MCLATLGQLTSVTQTTRSFLGELEHAAAWSPTTEKCVTPNDAVWPSTGAMATAAIYPLCGHSWGAWAGPIKR